MASFNNSFDAGPPVEPTEAVSGEMRETTSPAGQVVEGSPLLGSEPTIEMPGAATTGPMAPVQYLYPPPAEFLEPSANPMPTPIEMVDAGSPEVPTFPESDPSVAGDVSFNLPHWQGRSLTVVEPAASELAPGESLRAMHDGGEAPATSDIADVPSDQRPEVLFALPEDAGGLVVEYQPPKVEITGRSAELNVQAPEPRQFKEDRSRTPRWPPAPTPGWVPGELTGGSYDAARALPRTRSRGGGFGSQSSSRTRRRCVRCGQPLESNPCRCGQPYCPGCGAPLSDGRCTNEFCPSNGRRGDLEWMSRVLNERPRPSVVGRGTKICATGVRKRLRGGSPPRDSTRKGVRQMPQTTMETKRVIVTLAGDPDDTLYEIDVEPGSTPDSIFEAMGLEKDPTGKFQFQLSKPGARSGVFGDKENVYVGVKSGDKLQVVPKNPVATL
jgi:hypothetical protein